MSHDRKTAGVQPELLHRALDAEGVIGLLQDLCRVPSVTGSEQQVATLLARRAQRLGFEVKLYELRGYGIPAPGRPSVVFRLKGSGEGPSLMLNAHLDTEKVSPLYDALGEDPFSGDLRDGYVYGLGVYNAKAQAAALLHVMKALRDVGFTPKGDIIYAATVGEMDAGTGARFLLSNGIVADMGICGLPTGFGIPTAHAGCLDVRIVLRGKPAHVNWPERGVSVTPQLARLIQAFPRLRISYEPRWKGVLEPRWNVSYICGGHEYRTGVLLDECALGMCVRAPAGSTPLMIQDDLTRFLDELAREDAAFSADLSILNPIPDFCPPFEVSPDEFVVRAVARAHQDIFGEPPFVGIGPIAYGYTDAAVMRAATGMPWAIYGPGGEVGVHAEPERVKVDDVLRAIQVYALATLSVATSSWDDVRAQHRLPV